MLEHGEHYLHTDEKMNYYIQWLRDNIIAFLLIFKGSPPVAGSELRVGALR